MLVTMDKLKDKFDWVDWMVAEREKRGMSPADLAKATGLTRNAISTYENRKRPNPDVRSLSKISLALGYPEDYMARMVYDLPELELTPEEEQILHEVSQLPIQDQQEVLAYIRMKKNIRKKNDK